MRTILLAFLFSCCIATLQERASGRVLLWDHSARMTTAENVRSVDWLTYSEGSTVTVPFADWPLSRMLQENKTSLFIHLTFVVRDTSTTMVSVASDDEGEVEACLVDGLLPPLHMPPLYGAKKSGFRVALRNRGTWSSVAIEIPGVETIFVETIIIPYAETDVDIQIDFKRNEVIARANTRNRKSGGLTVTKRNPTPIPPLNTWPELLTIGTDRHSSKRFTPKTDWEVYSTSLKVGTYSDPPLTQKEQMLRGQGTILYSMNDPPIRFPKLVRAKIFPGALPSPGASFLRLSFSFTLTSQWRRWYDRLAKAPADNDSPSILCMAKPTAPDSKVNLVYPVGVRVWIKPDITTNDSYVNVEVGDGTQLTHRVVVNWPAIQAGVKYNGEIMVFFQTNGDPEGSRLPLFRFSSSPEDLFSPNVYVEVPRLVANKNHPPLSSWTTASNTDFTTVVVGGPCRGLTSDTSVLIDSEQFVVESIQLSREPAFPVGSILTAKNNALYAAPTTPLLMNAPVPAGSAVTGYKKTIHMRGGEQKHSPRYAVLNSPLNFTLTRPALSQGLIVAGEFYTSSCTPYSWSRNDSASRLDEIPVPTMVPILDLHNFLSIGVDCANNKQLTVILRGQTITDSRFVFPENTFQSFRITLSLPDTDSTNDDWVEISVGSVGSIRTVVSQRIPRQGFNSAMWLGREQVQRRVIYGTRGWMVRNVELASFEYVPCIRITDLNQCPTYINCAWVKNVGCRPTTEGTNNHNSATSTPTLQSAAPSTTPTLSPTRADFKTASPTTGRPTTTRSPTYGEYEDTPSPTSKAPTPVPTYPPGTTLVPSQSPTWSPWTWGGGEYEYEYEYEFPPWEYEDTSAPSLPNDTPRPTSRPTTISATTVPTLQKTLSPTVVNAPTSRSPSKSPSFFVPTEAPDFANPPSITPTPDVVSSPVPTLSPLVLGSGSNDSLTSSGSNAAGIGVGTTFAIVACAGIAFFIYRRQNHRANGPAGPPKDVTEVPDAKPANASENKAADSLDLEYDVL